MSSRSLSPRVGIKPGAGAWLSDITPNEGRVLLILHFFMDVFIGIRWAANGRQHDTPEDYIETVGETLCM